MRETKQQFNTYLPPTLVWDLKRRALDEQLSLSDLTAKILDRYLKESPMPTKLRLQPMIHVDDMPRSVAFYEALGASVRHGSRDGDWVLLALGDAEFSLLAHPANPEQNEGKVELSFESDEALDALQGRLEGAGVKVVREASDEAFGAQLQVESPDGLLVKINRIDRSLVE